MKAAQLAFALPLLLVLVQVCKAFSFLCFCLKAAQPVFALPLLLIMVRPARAYADRACSVVVLV